MTLEGAASVVRLFVREIMTVVGLGGLVGVGLALPLGRVIEDVAAGVGTHDYYF